MTSKLQQRKCVKKNNNESANLTWTKRSVGHYSDGSRVNFEVVVKALLGDYYMF